MAIVPVRRVFRTAWILLTLGTLCAIPWMLVELDRARFDLLAQTWCVAGVLVVLSVSMSIYQVLMHLEHYNRPRLQVRVVRILLMVPIYAIDAWLALRFRNARAYLDPVRECYEAFVIYNFYAYLIAYLEDEFGDLDAYFSHKPATPHLPPLDRWCEPWPPGAAFFEHARRGVLAYVLARPLCTLAAGVAGFFGVYGDDQPFALNRAYLYTSLVGSTAQTWALYCLILVYQATHTELAPVRPLAKFLCIKMVVFFSYWQSIALAIAGAFGGLAPIAQAMPQPATQADAAGAVQNALICVEMFFAAIAHAWAFPPRDYVDTSRARARPGAGVLRNLAVMWDVRDVVSDVHQLVSGTVADVHDSVADAARRAAHKAATPKRWIEGLVAKRGASKAARLGAAGEDDPDLEGADDERGYGYPDAADERTPARVDLAGGRGRRGGDAGPPATRPPGDPRSAPRRAPGRRAVDAELSLSARSRDLELGSGSLSQGTLANDVLGPAPVAPHELEESLISFGEGDDEDGDEGPRADAASAPGEPAPAGEPSPPRAASRLSIFGIKRKPKKEAKRAEAPAPRLAPATKTPPAASFDLFASRDRSSSLPIDAFGRISLDSRLGGDGSGDEAAAAPSVRRVAHVGGAPTPATSGAARQGNPPRPHGHRAGLEELPPTYSAPLPSTRASKRSPPPPPALAALQAVAGARADSTGSTRSAGSSRRSASRHGSAEREAVERPEDVWMPGDALPPEEEVGGMGGYGGGAYDSILYGRPTDQMRALRAGAGSYFPPPGARADRWPTQGAVVAGGLWGGTPEADARTLTRGVDADAASGNAELDDAAFYDPVFEHVRYGTP